MLLLRLELVLCINLCYNSLCVKCVLIVNIFNIVMNITARFDVRFDISSSDSTFPVRFDIQYYRMSSCLNDFTNS